MDLLLEVDPRGPKRRQIEQQLRTAIRDGRLARGARLPPTRVLADQLGVARGTVLEAYGQLVAEGYLVGRPGSATVVGGTVIVERRDRTPPPPVSSPMRFDLRSGVTDAAAFPRSAWLTATTAALRGLSDDALVARHRGGYRPLREALAEYLSRSRATVAEPEQVIVTAGLAHGVTVALEVLRGRGTRRVAVEDPCWPLHVSAVRAAGLEPVGVRVDERGLDVDALAQAGVDAVIVTPAHHYPTGVVLSAERRTAIVAWARQAGATIVEDDYDAEFRYDRAPNATLQGMAPESVLYAGTASKTLIPTLRMGWLVAPTGLALDIERRNARLGAWPSLLEQATVARLLDQGQFQRHVRHASRRFRARREVLVEMLRRHLPLPVAGVAAGLHLLAWLPPETDERDVIAQARERGIAVHGLHTHSTSVAQLPPGLLIGYACCDGPALAQAVQLLAGLPCLAST